MDGVKLMGLWKNTSQSGIETLSGNLGGARIVIFPNGYKKEDKHPDYIVYICENKKREDAVPKPDYNAAMLPNVVEPPKPPPKASLDDIPW